MWCDGVYNYSVNITYRVLTSTNRAEHGFHWNGTGTCETSGFRHNIRRTSRWTLDWRCKRIATKLCEAVLPLNISTSLRRRWSSSQQHAQQAAICLYLGQVVGSLQPKRWYDLLPEKWCAPIGLRPGVGWVLHDLPPSASAFGVQSQCFVSHVQSSAQPRLNSLYLSILLVLELSQSFIVLTLHFIHSFPNPQLHLGYGSINSLLYGILNQLFQLHRINQILLNILLIQSVALDILSVILIQSCSIIPRNMLSRTTATNSPPSLHRGACRNHGSVRCSARELILGSRSTHHFWRLTTCWKWCLLMVPDHSKRSRRFGSFHLEADLRSRKFAWKQMLPGAWRLAEVEFTNKTMTIQSFAIQMTVMLQKRNESRWMRSLLSKTMMIQSSKRRSRQSWSDQVKWAAS